jgi:hypothetical protein
MEPITLRAKKGSAGVFEEMSRGTAFDHMRPTNTSQTRERWVEATAGRLCFTSVSQLSTTDLMSRFRLSQAIVALLAISLYGCGPTSHFEGAQQVRAYLCLSDGGCHETGRVTVYNKWDLYFNRARITRTYTELHGGISSADQTIYCHTGPAPTGGSTCSGCRSCGFLFYADSPPPFSRTATKYLNFNDLKPTNGHLGHFYVVFGATDAYGDTGTASGTTPNFSCYEGSKLCFYD